MALFSGQRCKLTGLADATYNGQAGVVRDAADGPRTDGRVEIELDSTPGAKRRAVKAENLTACAGTEASGCVVTESDGSAVPDG